MRTITLNEVHEVYQALLEAKMSREEAAEWATEICENEDEGNLTYSPETSEEVIWQGVEYIQGFDMAGFENEYLLTLEDLSAFFDKILSDHSQ